MKEQIKSANISTAVTESPINAELTTHNGLVDTQEVIAKWLPVTELVKVVQSERSTIELEGDDQ